MTKRILVVEDQEDLRGVLRDIFTNYPIGPTLS
jgi:CheY-like chemotaxis protein